MELQVSVPDDEYNDFKQRCLRELWPPTRAYCNVAMCDKTMFYKSFSRLPSTLQSCSPAKNKTVCL